MVIWAVIISVHVFESTHTEVTINEKYYFPRNMDFVWQFGSHWKK